MSLHRKQTKQVVEKIGLDLNKSKKFQASLVERVAAAASAANTASDKFFTPDPFVRDQEMNESGYRVPVALSHALNPGATRKSCFSAHMVITQVVHREYNVLTLTSLSGASSFTNDPSAGIRGWTRVFL